MAPKATDPPSILPAFISQVLCVMAEKGVKSISSVAVTSALPIIQKLEPQIIVANARGAMTRSKDAVTTIVTRAKDSMTGSVEKTKSMINGSIKTILGCRMMQLVSSGMENALTKSELLKPSYYIRLGSLSMRLCSHTYQQAISWVKEAKQKSQEIISQLHSTINLIEFARKDKRNIGHDDTDESHCAEHIESCTLAIACNLIQQLQTMCHTLLHLGVMAGDICWVFHNAASFKEVSDGLFTSNKGQLQNMKESLDVVMDYLVNNMPLNWLSQNAQGTQKDTTNQEAQQPKHKTHQSCTIKVHGTRSQMTLSLMLKVTC
ncbi:unnamed protein product [Nyctereutes procyonoides]|uniref:(raccoon dog) hypothetical protein n=1 Tax=Nyctereutes procyonoides TaxID=34880 RepID=A0A811YPJ0_NYCPR|nr:unnamed protein product [Nyctereutes procyonoides]